MMKLSVLMPVFNEKPWIEKIVGRVLNQNVVGIDALELIIVDDGSSDGSRDVIQELVHRDPHRIQAVYHERNQGKGASIQSAIQSATGEICIIQDADLEYDPSNYALVLEPIIEGRADCVYGSRFVGEQAKRVLFFWHYVGNRFLTLFSNALTNLNLTDMETGCKAFRMDALKEIPIKSQDFRFEPEITAKVARRSLRIFEVGISYNGRTYAEGKKINWFDGVRAIQAILYFALYD